MGNGFEYINGPLSCFRCKETLINKETKLMQIPIPTRYPKQRKKLKANTHIGLLICEKCEKQNG